MGGGHMMDDGCKSASEAHCISDREASNECDLAFYQQEYLSDPGLKLQTPALINLTVDPKEEKAFDQPYLHTWVAAHVGKILLEYGESVKREPLIPAGAPLNYVPNRRPNG